MSDFEGRLTEVLQQEAEAAPAALGLAHAARGRARARRRQRIAAIGAGAVAALAIPVAVVVIGGADDDPARVADQPTAVPTEGRWESWHGITVQVPDDWQYGNQATWCASGGSAEQFLITRPGGVSEMIACTPASSYGLAFQEIEMKDSDEPFDWPVVTQTGDAWPPGTYVGAHGEDGVLVTVAGPDREEVLDVLATVRPVGDSDANGCAPRVEDDQLVAILDAMSVCRYDTTGALEQSELLRGSDAEDAAQALDGMRQADLDCEPAEVPGPTIDMFDAERDVTFQLNGACTAADGTPWGIVDADVLWWALSPGFTGDTTGLNLPSVLRSYDPAA